MLNIPTDPFSQAGLEKNREGMEFRITVHLGFADRGIVAPDVECICWMHGPEPHHINAIAVEATRYGSGKQIVDLVGLHEKGPDALGMAIWLEACAELERRDWEIADAWCEYERDLKADYADYCRELYADASA